MYLNFNNILSLKLYKCSYLQEIYKILMSVFDLYTGVGRPGIHLRLQVSSKQSSNKVQHYYNNDICYLNRKLDAILSINIKYMAQESQMTNLYFELFLLSLDERRP